MNYLLNPPRRSKSSIPRGPTSDKGDYASGRNFDAQESLADMHTLPPAHLSLAITDGQLPCPGIFSELEYHAPFQRAIDHHKYPREMHTKVATC
jgi:hypothetical protein